MIVKCMGSENAPDDDSRKAYRLLSGVKTIEFVRPLLGDTMYEKENHAIAVMTMEDGSHHEEHCYGNIYVMNDSGKTVSSFGVAQLP